MSTRLPIPGGDDNTWGDILNAYLEVSHDSTGNLLPSAIIQAGGITTVNGHTGATITLTASDVGAGTYSKPVGGIPATDLTSAVQTELTAASTAVQSVNGHNGTSVTLAAGDVGALTESQANSLYVPVANVVSSSTIRQTTGAPGALSTDQAGDFAYDPAANIMYGPFTGNGTGGSWPAGVLLSQGFMTIASPDTSSPVSLAAGVLRTANSGASVYNLPSGPTPGQIFGVQRGSSTSTITINAGTGQTINNGSPGGSISLTGTGAVAQQGFVWLMATSSTNFQIMSSANTDAGLGYLFGGAVSVQGQFATNALFQANGSFLFGSKFAGHAITKTSAYNPTLYSDYWIRCTANSFTVTMGTSSFTAGQMQLVTNEGSGTITLAAAAGTIDVTTLPPSSGVVLMFDGTNWHTVGSYGLNINSSNRAAISTILNTSITSGTAFTPSSAADVEIFFIVTSSVSLSISYGPSTGAENSLFTSVSMPTGSTFTKTIPKGWKVIITGTVSNISSITVQTL